MQRSKVERERIYGSPERQTFVRGLGCLICGADPQLAHTATGGMGRKADAATIVPLCDLHHRELHQHGVSTFARRWGIDLTASAAWIEEQWRQQRDTHRHLTAG
jgi:hypothetical protein